MLIQPVEWHMKKVEEEVIVDEKMQLLEENKKGVNNNKEYSSASKDINRKDQQATATPAAGDGSIIKNISQSHNELNKNTSLKDNINGTYCFNGFSYLQI